jgi:hypothetical protein
MSALEAGGGQCWIVEGGKSVEKDRMSWRNPGLTQGDIQRFLDRVAAGTRKGDELHASGYPSPPPEFVGERVALRAALEPVCGSFGWQLIPFRQAAHQSEAQHPKSPAIHKRAGRLPHLVEADTWVPGF